jgi:hypothetical protein
MPKTRMLFDGERITTSNPRETRKEQFFGRRPHDHLKLWKPKHQTILKV